MAAEGYEAYHVPQQTRRDKLRGIHTNFVPNFYNNNPSFLPNPSDLLTIHDYKDKSMDPQISPSFHEINNHTFLYNINQNHQSSNFHHDVTHNPNNNNYVSTGQGLSLSLSSRDNTAAPELNSSLFTTAAAVAAAYCCNNELLCKSSGPFTGYASILKGSRFLKPAQLLMEEICGINYAEKLLEPDEDSVGVMDPSIDGPDDNNGSEHRRNKYKLITMLHEVCRRYKQYYQQVQGVVASFESVSGLGNAAPFANLSLKALSKHFRCLKNTISHQMNYTIKTHSHSSQINCDDSTSTRSVGKGNFNHNNFQRVALHNAGYVEHHHQPVWRPQRGLPGRAVTVLRAWLFDHFLHPYPTDSDKVMLAKQTGLSRNQVSNWFINARVRLWKPMVEEIHMLESRQANKSASQRMQGQTNNSIKHTATNNYNNSLPPDQNPSTSSVQQFQQVPSKRTRNNDPHDQIMNCLPRSCVGIDHVSASTGGNGGVSLTLGLQHQNHNGIGNGGLSLEPFPRNAARRFGIEANNEGFMFGTGGFEEQNRHNSNINGGQLLHDFVG